MASAELSAHFLPENEDKFVPPHKYFHNFPFGKLGQGYSTAMASISITAPFGMFATSRADLAGLWSPKNSS